MWRLFLTAFGTTVQHQYFTQHYGWPEHKPESAFLHVDKQGCSWSYSMQHNLSVLRRDTERSYAKLNFRSQGHTVVYIYQLCKESARLARFLHKRDKIKHSGFTKCNPKDVYRNISVNGFLVICLFMLSNRFVSLLKIA